MYNVANFDMIQEVQKKIITEVCSGVDEQLGVLVSGEESKLKHFIKFVVAKFGFDMQ